MEKSKTDEVKAASSVERDRDFRTLLEESSSDLGRSLDAMKILCEAGEHEIIFTKPEEWDYGKMIAWMKLLRLSLNEAYKDLERVQAIYN